MRWVARLASLAGSFVFILVADSAGQDRSGSTREISGLALEARIRVAEAYHLIDAVGHPFWQAWEGAPRSVLLVTEESEYLLHHPAPPAEFERIGYDSLVASDVWARDRTLPIRIGATVPIGGLFTAAIGPPTEIGARSATSWVLTLVHEHFHQLQLSDSAYMAEVTRLAPALRDSTGTWMVSHPFPYDSPPVAAAFRRVLRALHGALRAREGDGFEARLESYLAAYADFGDLLSVEDLEYLEFQLWQEGVPRYVELMISRLAAPESDSVRPAYEPLAAFLELPGFIPYSELAASFERRVIDELLERDPAVEGREVVYPFGAAVALLLDAASPGWKARYRTERFSLHAYFD